MKAINTLTLALGFALSATAISADLGTKSNKNWAWTTRANSAGAYIAMTGSEVDRNAAMTVMFFPATRCEPMLSFVGATSSSNAEVTGGAVKIDAQMELRVDKGPIYPSDVFVAVEETHIELYTQRMGIEHVRQLLEGSKLRLKFTLEGESEPTFDRFSLLGSTKAITGAYAACKADPGNGDEEYFAREERELPKQRVKSDAHYFRM